MTNDNKSYEIDQIGERKANEIKIEESEIDERYEIENNQTFNSIYHKQNRENDYLVDTGTELEQDTVHDTKELEKNTNKFFTNVIFEIQQNDEVIYEKLIVMLLKRYIIDWKILPKI